MALAWTQELADLTTEPVITGAQRIAAIDAQVRAIDTWTPELRYQHNVTPARDTAQRTRIRDVRARMLEDRKRLTQERARLEANPQFHATPMNGSSWHPTANQIRVEAELLRLADLLDKENQLGEAEDDGVRRLAEEVVRLKEDEDSFTEEARPEPQRNDGSVHAFNNPVPSSNATRSPLLPHPNDPALNRGIVAGGNITRRAPPPIVPAPGSPALTASASNGIYLTEEQIRLGGGGPPHAGTHPRGDPGVELTPAGPPSGPIPVMDTDDDDDDNNMSDADVPPTIVVNGGDGVPEPTASPDIELARSAPQERRLVDLRVDHPTGSPVPSVIEIPLGEDDDHEDYFDGDVLMSEDPSPSLRPAIRRANQPAAGPAKRVMEEAPGPAPGPVPKQSNDGPSPKRSKTGPSPTKRASNTAANASGSGSGSVPRPPGGADKNPPRPAKRRRATESVAATTTTETGGATAPGGLPHRGTTPHPAPDGNAEADAEADAARTPEGSGSAGSRRPSSTASSAAHTVYTRGSSGASLVNLDFPENFDSQEYFNPALRAQPRHEDEDPAPAPAADPAAPAGSAVEELAGREVVGAAFRGDAEAGAPPPAEADADASTGGRPPVGAKSAKGTRAAEEESGGESDGGIRTRSGLSYVASPSKKRSSDGIN